MTTADALIVTAEQPYIGCAVTGNRAAGCPAPGTLTSVRARGRAARRSEVIVQSSRCLAEAYVPDCNSPVFPFGICECDYIAVRRRRRGARERQLRSATFVGRGPCSTDSLSWDGVEADEIVVESRDGITFTGTGHSDYTDPGQEPTYSYNRTGAADSSIPGGSVSLQIFVGREFIVDTEPVSLLTILDELTEEGDVSEDYYD